MFFDDLILTKRKSATLKAPPIPDTNWKPPQYFPDLSQASVISFDTETRELDFDHGPGWARGKGHIVGVSVAARWGDARGYWSGYFPLRHEVERDWNMEPRAVFGWLKDSLETRNIPKVGANLLYDIGWLTTENIEVKGDLYDVQFAEALLDETAPTALEHLGTKYCGAGKDSAGLYAWLSQAYGGRATGAQRSNIFRAPPRLVGPYAESDADLPLQILDEQYPLLAEQGLLPLFRMECQSIPMLVRMRLAGVRVDLDQAERLHASLGSDITSLYERLVHETGIKIDSVSSADQVSRVFDSVGIQYPRSKEGKPSFKKEWLTEQAHPIAALINDIREHEKIKGTFIQSYILESHNNGQIHCQFHPLRSDDGGTKTGRYASSYPNLQNIPVRTPLGKKVRKILIPDIGHTAWRKGDHSQIEYRMLAHFATGAGSDELRGKFNNDPKTDYHDFTQALVKEKTGRLIDRKPIKNINFGLLYGQTQKSLAFKAGFSPGEATQVFEAYHAAAPYVKATMAMNADEAQRNGFITTVLGRRTRFNLWEPAKWTGQREFALPYEQALSVWGHNIKRAGDYKATNYRFQGSAADCLKQGMLACYDEGVFDVIGVPRLQVHDELNFSEIDNSPAQNEAYEYMWRRLETACPQLRIPLRVDRGRGPNWGEVKE